MPRFLRIYLLGCIAISFAYLVLHAREPLRLNVGDPWADANVMSSVEYLLQHGFTPPQISETYNPPHDPPRAIILYVELGKLGVRDIGTLRMIALAFSMLWTWFVFLYARRIWGDTVALLAASLLATSVLWMMYADCIDRPPIVHASCFLALWGLVRAIETKQRRYYAAAIAGSFGCMFGAPDDRVLLLAGVLFTVHLKLGNPFAPGNRRFVATCAIGSLAAILMMRSVFVTGPVEWHAGSIEWRAAIDDKLVAPLSSLVRRYTLVFTPMFWIALGCTAWRALRAPSLTAVIEDVMIGLLVVAALVLYASSPHTASPMLHARPVLPFYALGAALLIARLLEGRRLARAFAIAWGTAAPVWGFYVLLSHPRSVLDRGEVARVRSYLAANDRNDFVMTNLLSDGPIQVSFDRHSWPVLETGEGTAAHDAQLAMLSVFESVGTDYLHAVIFTTPESRFVDRSLGQLVMRRHLASVTGWPYLNRSKANTIISDYDKKVLKTLEAVGAKQVLHLSNFDVYRIDRASILEEAGRSIPLVREIDFSSLGSRNHTLLGWGHPWLTKEEQLGVTTIDGQGTCSNPLVEDHRAGEPGSNRCETVLTGSGLRVLDERRAEHGQLMIRVERVCDLRLTLELASWSLLTMSVDGFTNSQCEPAKQVAFLVPQRFLHAGINIITLEKTRFGLKDPRADVRSLAIEPICESNR